MKFLVMSFPVQMVREALRRVRHDLLFVGLTERWDAAVCLFHARLGGAPVDYNCKHD